MLDALHESLLPLIALRSVSEAVELSISAIFLLCVELFHLVFHFSLIALLCLHFSAVGLVVSL